jgi:hypothetical protein
MLHPPLLDSCKSFANNKIKFVEDYKKYLEQKGNIHMRSLIGEVVFDRVLH